MRKIAVSLALCLLLAGCGQTGVQPEAEPAPEASQTPAVVLPEEDWEEPPEPEGCTCWRACQCWTRRRRR